MFSEKVHVMNHPLVAHKLTILRDKNTSVKDFRELVSEIGMLITYEATRDLPLTTKVVETPLCKAELPTLAGKKFAVVPILRAGLGLVDGVLRMVPSARVGHIGMFRDEETLEPHVYFCKMPKDVADRDIIIVDPMLATGAVFCHAHLQMPHFPKAFLFLRQNILQKIFQAGYGIHIFLQAHLQAFLFHCKIRYHRT